MKLIFSLFLAGFTLAAQSPRAQGYAFVGVENPSNGTFNDASAGAGADIFVYKDAAFSPSAAYLFNFANGGGLAVVTLNGSYHFLRGKSRLEPFVTAGYGALANIGNGVSLFNYGGGGQYWISKRVGVRVELLNFQQRQYRELTSVRFGVAFR